MATVYLKRRDLLRLFSLDPRDLRCIDPNLHYTRLSPSLYVRGNVILAQLAGVRLIITGTTALLLDPHSSAARKLLGQLIPKLQARAAPFSACCHCIASPMLLLLFAAASVTVPAFQAIYAQGNHSVWSAGGGGAQADG